MNENSSNKYGIKIDSSKVKLKRKNERPYNFLFRTGNVPITSVSYRVTEKGDVILFYYNGENCVATKIIGRTDNRTE